MLRDDIIKTSTDFGDPVEVGVRGAPCELALVAELPGQFKAV